MKNPSGIFDFKNTFIQNIKFKFNFVKCGYHAEHSYQIKVLK